MNVQVHTYSNPRDWKAHSLYSSFPNALHICATNNQKKGIRSCYSKDIEHIFSFREFIKALYVKWYSPETKFQQYLRLTKIIAGLSNDQQDLKHAFRTNALVVLETIRFLVEANVRPQALQNKWLETKKEIIFKEIWEKFINDDIDTLNHYHQLEKSISKRDIEKAISYLCGKEIEFQEGLHIVLHGFYFITPEQQVFLEILRNQKVQITFFNYYDSRFRETFDFIKAFVSDRFGWPSPDKWNYEKTSFPRTSNVASIFLSAYETGRGEQNNTDTEITRYSSFFDFLHDVILPHFPVEATSMEDDDTNVSLFSPNAEKLNEMLLTYYPELNSKKRNFLSYPIGRFLVSLHEIYNNGEMILTEKIIIELFSSGWLYDELKRENGLDYTHDLQLLFPYLNGCRDIGDWVNRLESLINQGLTIGKAFPVEQENRIIRSVRSPFSKISHFSVPLNRVKQIKTFIEKIKLMTNTLFAEASNNRIDVHFSRLHDILSKNNRGVSLIANENEKILISELQVKLGQIDDKSEFLYDDLQTALHYYLSGKLNNDDENFINGFVEIDGEMFKTHEQTIYITGLDESSLPLGTQTTPWPLQAETFERLSDQVRALELHTIRIHANKYISRYLFFIALNLSSENAKLSWIKNLLDQQELQPALYVKQLGLRVSNYDDTQPSKDKSEFPSKFLKEEFNDEEIKSGLKTLAFEDFFAEYELCPKRFYFSYIVDEFPTFSNDFIHQFMFSEIIRVAGQGTKAVYETVLSEVSPLFPQWSEFKKRVSAKRAFTFVPNNLGEKTTVVDAHSYTETRKNFQFPGFTKQFRNDLFDKTRTSYEKIINELVSKDNETMNANTGYSCRFCPHNDYCSDATHSIDLRKEEGEK